MCASISTDEPSRTAPLLTISLAESSGLAALLVALFAWTLSPLAGFDFWFYLAVGRDIIEQGRIPWSQSYLGSTSSLAFGRYADQAWLGNLVNYLAWAAGGPVGLVLLKSSLLTVTTAVVYLSNRIVGLAPFWAGAWSTLALWTIRGRFELRTYLLSDLALAILAALLILQERDGGTRRSAVGLALLFALWTNLHQGIIAGFVIIVCWAIFGRTPWRQRLTLTAVAAMASLARPHPLAFPAFLYDHFSNSTAIEGVIEWAAPGRGTLVYELAPFYLSLSVLVSVGVYRRWREGTLPPHAFAVVGFLFAALALRSIRSISELLPVVCPLAAAYFPDLPRNGRAKVFIAVLLGAMLLATFRPSSWSRLTRLDGYPDTLVNALPAGSGQIYNSFECGNYLVFRRIPPFLHGMTAFYQEGLIQDFRDVLNPTPRRYAILEKFGVGAALLHFPTEQDATLSLVDTLADSPDWKLSLWDDSGLLFVRGDREDGLKHVRPWRSPPWTDGKAAKQELAWLVERTSSAMAHVFLSKLLLEEGDNAQAARHANLAVEISPGFYQAWGQLGLCYARANNLPGVLSASRGGVKAAPDQAGAHFNRALALYEQSLRASGPSSIWSRWMARYHARKALWLEPSFSPAGALLHRL